MAHWSETPALVHTETRCADGSVTSSGKKTLQHHVTTTRHNNTSLVGNGVLFGSKLNILIFVVIFIIAVVQENTNDFP